MKRFFTFIPLVPFCLAVCSQITPREMTGLSLTPDSQPLISLDLPVQIGTDEGNRAVTQASSTSNYNLHPHISNSYTVNTGYEVGEIPFTTDITPTGGMNIDIPVEIPQVPSGFAPKISLNYNSQAGNGIAGYGWNIGGLSSITAVNRTVYHNGISKGVTINCEVNAYALDGMRLIKTGDNTFITEQGNIKVVVHVLNAILYKIYKYFDVYYPDGSKAVYGYYNNDLKRKVEYPVVSITDKDGNTIRYNYSYSNEKHILNSISYGREEEVKIDFAYKTRDDIHDTFIAGRRQRQNYLLSTITTTYNDNILKTYMFSHVTRENVSVISKVACTADAGTFNPLQFHYGDNTQSDTYIQEDVQLTRYFNFGEYPGQIRVAKGKFDYFSDSDGLIMLENKLHYAGSGSSVVNFYRGNEDIQIATTLDSGFSLPSSIKTENGFVDIFCTEVDEIPGDEIVKINNYQLSGTKERLDFHVYTTYLTGLVKKYTRTFEFETVIVIQNNRFTYRSILPKYYFTGDFTGNGKMEILAVSITNPLNQQIPSAWYLFDLEGNRIISQGESPFNYIVKNFGNSTLDYDNSDKLYIVDYDGDGKNDICLINNEGTHTYTYSNGAFSHVNSYPGLTNSMLAKKDLLPGEFNGDGKTDLLLSPLESGNVWTIFSSDGAGHYLKKELSITLRVATSKFMLQDMNGDGQTDLVETYYDDKLHVYFIADNECTGNRLKIIPEHTKVIPSSITCGQYYSQLLCINNNGIVNKITYGKDILRERLITGVTDSYGNVFKTAYEKLNQSSFYNKGYNAVFPYRNFNGPMMAVAADESYSDGNKTDGNYYQYENAVIHAQGLGFTGFEKIKRYSTHTGKYTYSEYDPFNYSVLKKQETETATDSYSYSFGRGNHGTLRILPTRQVSSDKLTGNTLTTVFSSYDTYGNLLSNTVDYGGGISIVFTQIYNNIDNPDRYIIGLPIQQSVQKKRGSLSFTTKTINGYNATYQPVSRTEYYNNYKVSEEAFVYNEQGFLSEFRSKAYNAGTWQSRYFEYDTRGRKTKEQDMMGLYIEYVYDGINGRLVSQKNHKGQFTTFEYDRAGRLYKQINPDGTTRQAVLGWASSSDIGLYYQTRELTGKAVEKVFYNAQGKEVRSSQVRFDDSELKTDRQYDNYGRLYKISLPYKSGTVQWNTCHYDTYNRLIRVTYASGKQETRTYSGNTLTETKDGISYVKTYDTAGNLVAASDSGGEIIYNLRADGQPLSIQTNGVSTVFSYDAYGRKVEINDPSAGRETIAYDAAGNINRQTDAAGRIITLQYDSYNRLITKTYPEFTTSYSYNSDNRLLSETSTNGTSHSFTYDNYGRIKTEQENAPDAKWLKKTYTYKEGNISKIDYASNMGSITSEAFAYKNGHMVRMNHAHFLSNSIELPGSGVTTFGVINPGIPEKPGTVKPELVIGPAFWELTAENERGQPESVTTGKINRTYTYDDYGYPVSRKATVSGNTVFHQVYSFDTSTGNLDYRDDYVNNTMEDFRYDNLNRLTGIEQAGRNIRYRSNGNIDEVTGVGLYEYEWNDKPYALTRIDARNNDQLAQHGENQQISYTSFKRPAIITQGDYAVSFTYNASGERVKAHQTHVMGGDLSVKYYMGGRYETDSSANTELLYIGGDAYTAPAVCKKEAGNWNVYYICRDYLGSICYITNDKGVKVEEHSYDAWGQLRDPKTHQVYDTPQLMLLDRGFTGHEHLRFFGLINMNARLYDPVVGRFLSPDPYVQLPDFTQSFNRYSYALNNPLKYTDPDGEIFLFIWLFFTESGYEFQKFVSPFAFHVNIHFGSEQRGIGYDYSYGVPKMYGISYRKHAGRTYYYYQHDNSFSGVEKRSGAEWTFGFANFSGTTFESGETSQTTNSVTLGLQGFFHIRYENDYMFGMKLPGVPQADGGDRYRSAAAEIKHGLFSLGINMFTGDPGFDQKDRKWEEINGRDTYIQNLKGDDPNKYRLGALYLGIGPVKVGRNSEKIREIFQNRFAHDLLTGGKAKWFEVLPNRKPKWYWYFGTETGNTLW